ncbi:hypothetical protein Hanom_Chr05g00390771 [Helianthus anomalus]
MLNLYFLIRSYNGFWKEDYKSVDGKDGLEDNPWFSTDYGNCVRGWWGHVVDLLQGS